MSAQVREKVLRLGGAGVSSRRRRLGLAAGELAMAALSLMLLLSAVLFYFVSLRPEQQRLTGLEQQLRDQEDVIVKEKMVLTPSDRSPLDQLTNTLDSLQKFKHELLKPEASGIIELFNHVNALAKKNNVKLTSGISMDRQEAQQDQADSASAGTAKGSKKAPKKTTDDASGVFSRAICEFTVFGGYQNIRSFISDLEHSKQFVVIKSIALKSGDDAERRADRGRRPRGESGSGISLSVIMTAYFQP